MSEREPLVPGAPQGRERAPAAPGAGGFTLIELLMVLGIVTLLLGLLLPALGAARDAGRLIVCQSNIRQLALSNTMYASDHKDHAMPAASNFLRNTDRWHGTRTNPSSFFKPEGGAITPYLEGATSRVRACPTFAIHAKTIREHGAGFEMNNGGYGYNQAFVGTVQQRTPWDSYQVRTDRVGSPLHWFGNPSGTVVFDDAAFASRFSPIGFIEYSFAEPPRFPHWPTANTDPSTHFRHAGRKAAIAWLDGHAETRTFQFSSYSHSYQTDPERVDVGWFGPDDNSLYDYD